MRNIYKFLIFCLLVSLNSCQSTDESIAIEKPENRREKSCLVEFVSKYELVDGINTLTLISNSKETENVTFLFDDSKDFVEEFARVKIKDKWGFIDKTRKIAIKPQFDDANDFSEGVANVKLNGKYGFIDPSGQFIIKPQFEFANDFKDGLARVFLNDKAIFIDKTGKHLFEITYESSYSFSEGLAIVKNKKKYGFIDKTGKLVIKLQFDDANDFKEGLAPIKIKGKWGYINQTGEIIIKPQFDSVEAFQDELAEIKLKDKFGFVNKLGKIVIAPNFEKITRKGMFAIIENDNSINFLEGSSLTELNPNIINYLEYANKSEEYSETMANEMYNTLEKEEKEVINKLFKLGEGLLRAKNKGKYGYIDETGKYIIKPAFDIAELFKEGFARVRINDKWGYLKKPLCIE